MEITSTEAVVLMDHLIQVAEHAHQTMVELSAITGFYRKRVCDVTTGDLVGYGANEWKLVVSVYATCTFEGEGIYVVECFDGTSHSFDPADIVDVKAEPINEPF
jgi:hypothetical protein